MKKITIVTLLAVATAGSLPAAVTFTVRDITPNGDAGTGTRSLTTSIGTVSAPASLPTLTYTVTNLDLTGVGGGLTDEIVFKVDLSQTGGTGIQFNTFGNISVTGGTNGDFFISPGEALTATVSLVSTTFSGGLANLSANFQLANIGGVSPDVNNPENWNIVHAGGTDARNSNQTNAANNSFPLSSFLTIQDVTGPNAQTINLQGYEIVVTAVPEPASSALLGLGALALLRRRRPA